MTSYPMIKVIKFYVILFVCLVWFLLGVATCQAGDWEFNFFGINPADFKGRSVPVILVGAVSSFIVHEAGHFAVGYLVGDGAYFDPNRGSFPGAVIIKGYSKMSHSQQQLFHGGGFLAQALVGTGLTLLPATRHSDFALGFNSFAMINSFGYTFQGDLEKNPASDVARLDNGEFVSITSGLLHTCLSYYNLNKED